MKVKSSNKCSSTRLAVHGGPVEFNGSFPPWPHFDVDEIEAVTAVLRSGKVNYWTGDLCRKFELICARTFGMPFCISVANGTLALELGLRALGIGPGDEVVTTPRSFYATFTSVRAVGAGIVFADVDRNSGNLTAESVEAALTPRTKAIVAVHMGGWPCDMPALRALAERHGLFLVEDCAQAHGAMIDGQSVGTWGDASAFSFCQDKIITTGGEGGMLLVRDAAVWARAWSYKDHGKSYQAVYRQFHRPGFRWVHAGKGSNWRMTEMQAAIGLCQVRKLPGWLRARRRNAAHMLNRFAALAPLRAPRPEPDVSHAYYRVYAYVRPDALNSSWSRDRIMTAIVAEGIPCGVGSCPELYLEVGVRDSGLAPEKRLPVAKELGETSLCFLCHPTLDEDVIETTCRAVEKVCAVAAR